jgi:antitoxin (DNA-binding transcriptional repressor) of toxin-antitoxin stability system
VKVKTGQLKAKLSSYLHRVQEEGASFVVCDRDRPVALLCPLDQIPGNDWSRRRMTLLAQAREAGLQLSISSRSPAKPRLVPQKPPLPSKSPTVASMRQGRSW